MTAVNAKYVAPVQGWGGEVQITWQQVDPDNMETFTDMATDFINNQPADAWTDAFYMMGESYDLTSCMCICPPSYARPWQRSTTTWRLAGRLEIQWRQFKTKMGQQNYNILNALRHKAENEERVAANAKDPLSLDQRFVTLFQSPPVTHL